MNEATDTIAAIATPPGKGGVGVVRVSGPDCRAIASSIAGIKEPRPRFAHYCHFRGSGTSDQDVIDQGLALFFPGPHSFTGEDVLELQGHGGPVVLDRLLRAVLHCGARMARPGEFSERAFLNNKIDLTQAEAIADLIDSGSEQAARQAMRSLDGAFSREVHGLVEATTQLRIYVEAAIDFPEEEIDFISDSRVATELQALEDQLRHILRLAQQGSLIKEGMTVVIAGKPNAGKSSLLNALAGKESAIVTDIAGTTRDVLRENILIDGMPLHIVDTAGLRDSQDQIEQEGIRRAWQEIERADQVLLVLDDRDIHGDIDTAIPQDLRDATVKQKLCVVINKIDISGRAPGQINPQGNYLAISAKTGAGLDALRNYLKHSVGYDDADTPFTARRRHLDALERGLHHVLQGAEQLRSQLAGELLAEELRLAQQCLAEITGEFRSDDLLGRIFSSFCIGK